MPRFIRLVPILLFAACGPSTRFTTEQVPTLTTIEDVMWAQSQAADPQFKKIGAASYSDDDYAQLTALAARIGATTAKVKKDFSKGPAFDAFAETLSGHAKELGDAAAAKDQAKSSLALQSMKDTCKACHKQFK